MTQENWDLVVGMGSFIGFMVAFAVMFAIMMWAIDKFGG